MIATSIAIVLSSRPSVFASNCKQAQKKQSHIWSLKKEKNANRTLRILTRLGYDAKRIAPNKNGFYPVLYGSYPTFAEAEKAKKEINIKHNPEAWILIQSLKKPKKPILIE